MTCSETRYRRSHYRHKGSLTYLSHDGKKSLFEPGNYHLIVIIIIILEKNCNDYDNDMDDDKNDERLKAMK